MNMQFRSNQAYGVKSTSAPLVAHAIAAEPVVPADWIMLDGFRMDRQCHTRWCWAAVTEAVLRYYDPSSTLTQRDIARIMMPDLPDGDFSAACYTDLTVAQDEVLNSNQIQVLMSVLLVTGCFGDVHRIPDEPAPLRDVQRWIDGDAQGRRAVCARIRWPNGNAHFVAITGYRPGTNLLHVWDPWGPQSRNLPYEEFGEHYSSLDGRLADTSLEGKWVDTLYTRRPH